MTFILFPAVAAASPTDFLQNFSFGSFGLLEVSALTTLIGSSAAESLILGNKGSAGLAWATLSAFSFVSVIKGCVSGASAGWLREILTVRSSSSDFAVGMHLGLDQSFRSVRGHVEAPLGITYDTPADDETPKRRQVGSSHKSSAAWRVVYAFDYSTSSMLQGIPEGITGKSPHVYVYANYDFMPKINTRVELSALALSLFKLSEFYILWAWGGSALAFATSIPWAYFFTVTLLFHLHHHSLYSPGIRTGSGNPGSIDIIAGRLPNSKTAGGARKVVLGAVDNYRTSLRYRIAWGMGAIICMGSLGAMFLLLGQSSSEIVNIWATFQLLWLVLRMLFNYFMEPVDWMAHRMLVSYSWESLSTSMKQRVFNLVLGVSKYQANVHPRGLFTYKEELPLAYQFIDLLSASPLHAHFPLEPSEHLKGGVEVEVVAVMGDTILSSTAWAFGLDLTSMDLYDSCVIILRLISPTNSSESLVTRSKTIAIPSARVLSESVPSIPAADVERNKHPEFIPKGSGNSGHNLTWWYWIPCAGNRWLQLCSEDIKFLGRRKAEVLTDAQLTARLAAGNLNISLTCGADVKEIVKCSKSVVEMLFK